MDGRGARAWAMVNRQHGVVTRKQLLGLGFSRSAIEHRLARGQLHRVGAWVYLRGRPESTREGRWMAAVLVCGPGAALSHVSAAALWGIEEERQAWTNVSVRGRFDGERADVRVRSRPSLPAEDIVERNDIPVTGLVRTLMDRACALLDRDTFRLSDHRLALTQARDLRRDQKHTATGLTALRFSHHQIVHERRVVIAKSSPSPAPNAGGGSGRRCGLTPDVSPSPRSPSRRRRRKRDRRSQLEAARSGPGQSRGGRRGRDGDGADGAPPRRAQP